MRAEHYLFITTVVFVGDKNFCRVKSTLYERSTASMKLDIRRGSEARDAGCAPAERFVDVWYAQLLHKPLANASGQSCHHLIPFIKVRQMVAKSA